MSFSRKAVFSAKIIKQVIILAAMMNIVLTLRHQQEEPSHIFNLIGYKFTFQMKSTFIKKINDAYSFCGNDTRQTTEYLAKQFENEYDRLYSVVILTTNQEVYNSVLYTNNNGNSFAQLTNVNTYQPNWSYIIWQLAKDSDLVPTFYDGIGKGSGVDNKKIAVIRNIISAQEQKYSQCMCLDQDLNTIVKKLRLFDNNVNQQWSIICKKYSESYFNGYLQSFKYEFIQIHANEDKCEYLFVRQW